MTRNKIKVGIIGGSGLDDPDLLKNAKELNVQTPYGKTSAKIKLGFIGGVEVAILARHGKKHTISPTSVPYRANIFALKKIGCTHILATTACGSLRVDIMPGDFVFVNQCIDFTKFRKNTYFENFRKKIVHTPMAHPFDEHLRNILCNTAKKLKINYHSLGTIITIEGPRFSTFAESIMFQKLGADLVNMSTCPEVFLANELGIPYQSIAMVTDYDCWKENSESVSIELVFRRMKENSEKVKKLLIETINLIK